MNRFLTGFTMHASLAAVVIACTGDEQIYGNPNIDPCSAYTTCGICTPVLGCGWCAAPGDHGACSSDPDTCAPESWTWNPSGCAGPAEPGLAPDAGATDASSDAPK